MAYLVSPSRMTPEDDEFIDDFADRLLSEVEKAVTKDGNRLYEIVEDFDKEAAEGVFTKDGYNVALGYIRYAFNQKGKQVQEAFAKFRNHDA